MDVIGRLSNLTDSVSNGADKLATSDDEVQKELTERLKIDTTSPFKLPHLIRPIAFIWAMALQTILSIVVLFVAPEGDNEALMIIFGSNSTILITIVGFYFQSRKNEKIAFKNAEANIELKALEIQNEARKEKLMLKEDIEDRKLERKLKAKENRAGLFGNKNNKDKSE